MESSSIGSSSVVKLGPWGSTDRKNGSAWDDGGFFTGIRGITIQHSASGVQTIKVDYDLLGLEKLGEVHGGGSLQEELEINKHELSFPGEFLTGISGYHDGNVVRSLMFKSNKNRIFGPQMSETSSLMRFDCSVDGGKGAIVGFSGRSDQYLNSLEIYVAVLCPAGEFFDAMEEQGLVAYRTSPLMAKYALHGLLRL
ncbi:jacalin-related lectin 3-like [Oryza glaberrima]|uniref:jacalin-related lectin 3-like n=1 Tax=Oryza glaberrima TaxID=4538 RepID=UPI00224C1118|nr:jacalin-related lectin 3-like [Oryza glaberrima]